MTHPRPGRDDGVVAVSICRRDRTEARTPRQQRTAVRLPFATLGAAFAAALLPVEGSAHLCCSFVIAVFAARPKNIPPHAPKTVFLRGCAWEVAPRKYKIVKSSKKGL